MLHLFRYRFVQTIRNFSNMFWALLFPIILGTLFYLSFGSAGLESTGESRWDEIKVAVVKDTDTSENAQAFEGFLTQMDGETLEINRCCTDPRYSDVCSCLYARAIRIGRELGYRRFLTYTLPEESGSSLRAVGFQPDGGTKASRNGWNSPSRPRDTDRYPAGGKLRWVLYIQ